MSNVDKLFTDMQQRFNPEAAAGLDAVFQYDIDDAGSWQARIADGTCSITPGTELNPTVTLSMSADTFADIMSGETDGMQAFMSGALKASGDIMLATRLPDLFPVT